MATWDEVRDLASGLPETVEGTSGSGYVGWRVGQKGFAWERPLRRSDLQALGDAAPQGPILAVRVSDLGVKEAVLAEESAYCFTTPHFNGYPAVLVDLEHAPLPELAELLAEAWLCRAPKRLVKRYLAERDAQREETSSGTTPSDEQTR